MVLRNVESIRVDFGALFFVARQREDHPSTPAFTAVEIADAARSGEAIHPDPGFLANRMHRVSLPLATSAMHLSNGQPDGPIERERAGRWKN
jgi:hypothetical protein